MENRKSILRQLAELGIILVFDNKGKIEHLEEGLNSGDLASNLPKPSSEIDKDS
jgi:hypothetical protein